MGSPKERGKRTRTEIKSKSQETEKNHRPPTIQNLKKFHPIANWNKTQSRGWDKPALQEIVSVPQFRRVVEGVQKCS
jgi:hypothetical protein